MRSSRFFPTSLRHRTTAPLARPAGWLVTCGGSLSAAPAWHTESFAAYHCQPVISPAQRWVVCGEVWLSNRAALLAEVQSEAADRPSFTDLEIIAALWEREGCALIARLEGMFGLAIWDREKKELWLVRDRIGARTIYYSSGGSSGGPISGPISSHEASRAFYAAPQLRLLAQHLSPTVDPVALRDYLCCAFVPGDRTMWRGIRELRPGTWLRLPAGKPHTYWQVREEITDADKPLEWHASALRAQLEQVLTEYLPDGEAVGCYLSGGLDSSCVVALAKKLHTHPVHTYSIHFGDETPNELEFSSLVAQHCRTQHHIIEIKVEQMWELLPETMAMLDDPIGDPLTVPNLMLGRAAKQDVNVILNGEGGDPCFGGPKNQPMLLDSLYRPALAQTTDTALLPAYLASFQKCSADLPRLLKPEVWQAVRDEPSVFTPELSGTDSFLNRLMFINTRFKGADHILTKVSNLTQHCGLHGRSPLFDQRIVARSLTIPPAYKLSGAEEKAVLKAAVSDLLPQSILTRPKSGMMVPVQLWFRQYWPQQARALLLHRRACVREFLNQELLRDWLEYRGDTWGRYGVKLWLLVSLELWLQAQRRG